MGYTVQIRQRGVLTIPAELRERYGLDDGDVLTLIDLDGVLVLAPRTGVVQKLAAEIERERQRAGLTLEDLLAGVQSERLSESPQAGG